MTVGRIEGGVWTASTPHELVAHVRFGFGRETEPGRDPGAHARRRAEASPEVEIHFEGFRARAYDHPTTGPLVDAVSARRTARVLGSSRELDGLHRARSTRATSRGPCLCYGPIAGNLHGTDEWVDVESPGPDRDRGRPRAAGGPHERGTNGAIRAATDVGGTFTDLVYFSTDPETGVPGGRHGEVRHDAAGLRARRDERAAQERRRRSAEIAFLAHGTTLVINALDRAQGRRRRA